MLFLPVSCVQRVLERTHSAFEPSIVILEYIRLCTQPPAVYPIIHESADEQHFIAIDHGLVCLQRVGGSMPPAMLWPTHSAEDERGPPHSQLCRLIVTS